MLSFSSYAVCRIRSRTALEECVDLDVCVGEDEGEVIAVDCTAITYDA